MHSRCIARPVGYTTGYYRAREIEAFLIIRHTPESTTGTVRQVKLRVADEERCLG